MSQSRERDTPAAAGTGGSSEMNQGMRVLSYLIAGIGFYGLVGFGADRLLGTQFLLPIGLVAGAALAMYLVIKRFGGLSDAASEPGHPAEDTTDKGRV